MSDRGIASWFERNVKGGLDQYLKETAREIDSIDNPSVAAKTRLDFIKVVESILATLPQHQSSEGQHITINIVPATKEPENANTHPGSPAFSDGVSEE